MNRDNAELNNNTAQANDNSPSDENLHEDIDTSSSSDSSSSSSSDDDTSIQYPRQGTAQINQTISTLVIKVRYTKKRYNSSVCNYCYWGSLKDNNYDKVVTLEKSKG